jgi:hypothetical protein
MRASILVLVGFSAVFVACSHKDGPDDVAADTVAASDSTAQAQGSLDGVLQTATSADASAAAASFAPPTVKVWPASCETRTRDASCTADSCVVHVSFHGCTGPRGLVELSGDEDVTLTREGSTLRVAVQGLSLTANGHPFSRTATADVTFAEDGKRTAVWQGHTSHVRPDGVDVEHDGTRTVTFDPSTGCRAIRGTGVTTRGRREIDTTIDATVCRAEDGSEACPVGTETHVHRASGRTVTLTFDGSAQATLNRNGATSEVPLVCTAVK